MQATLSNIVTDFPSLATFVIIHFKTILHVQNVILLYSTYILHLQ